MKRSQRSKKTQKPTLTTSEEFWNQAIEDEESGDRWISSDLEKSLRFYQRAYNHYLSAINLDGTYFDAHYNAARLLFHVYLKFTSQEEIDLSKLETISTFETDPNSVIQPLNKILIAHQTTLNLPPPAEDLNLYIDICFNAAVLYTELIEKAFDEDVDFETLFNYASTAEELFTRVLQTQLADENIDIETLLDTIESAYKLVQTAYESTSNESQLTTVCSHFEVFVSSLDEVVSNKSADITDARMSDLTISKTSLLASKCLDFDSLLQLWQDPELPNNFKRFLQAADSVQNFVDTVILYGVAVNDDDKWKYLTTLNGLYKKAQELIVKETDLLKPQDAQNFSEYSILRISTLISRAEVDIERSCLNVPQAISNKEILLKNGITFLKGAINLSKESGGLKEPSKDKLTRALKRKQAELKLSKLV
ncbi:BA75_03718T0 [Komagataella pastoris]|uniref:BA75_03718T0 n=1 Tax=Komagataella pastoris TaxID=4922 RepID=A0A1B2JG64_PICPA|nr:BA75_03718T0 [Komagataella pastoris]